MKSIAASIICALLRSIFSSRHFKSFLSVYALCSLLVVTHSFLETSIWLAPSFLHGARTDEAS